MTLKIKTTAFCHSEGVLWAEESPLERETCWMDALTEILRYHCK